MPDIEMDNATNFIVASGCIYCDQSSQTTYINGMDKLMEAIRTAAGIPSPVQRPTIDPTTRNAVLYRLKIPGMYDMYMELINNHNADEPHSTVRPDLVFRFINDSSISFTTVFPPTNEGYYLFWAVYQSNLVAGYSDIGVTMAYYSYDNYSNLRYDGTPWEAPEYGDSLNSKILNSLAIHATFAFNIVTVVDSIHEGENPSGYRGILTPSMNFVWSDDQTSSIGKTFNTSQDTPSYYQFVPFTDATNTHVGKDILSSWFFTSDCSLYPPTEGMSKNGSFGSICPAIYMTPAWSPCSRCISINTKTMQWGGRTDNDSEANPTHYGPQYTQIGSKYFLKTRDIYMPVDEIPSS